VYDGSSNNPYLNKRDFFADEQEWWNPDPVKFNLDEVQEVVFFRDTIDGGKATFDISTTIQTNVGNVGDSQASRPATVQSLFLGEPLYKAMSFVHR
jgi:hypothetical protein